MKRFAKKAFTLVELLVVIAIIAILAVAGVVGYMAFTKKAEVNNDTSLVAELNNYVAAASATDKINTPTDIRNILVDDGIDLATLKLSAAKQGYIPGFDIVAKKFVLIKDNALADGYTAAKTSDVFAFAKTEAEANALKAAGFSLYLQSGYDKTSIDISGLGLDVGENTSISTVNYTGTTGSNDVVIRTNGGTLNIDAINDSAKHYGKGDVLNIDAIASSSYHEFGRFPKAEIKKGRIVVEDKAQVEILNVTGSGVVLDKVGDGTINLCYASSNEYIPTGTAEVEVTVEDVDIDEFVARTENGAYSTLSDALDNLGTSKTLFIVADINETFTASSATIMYNIQNPVTIDGQGHTINAEFIVNNTTTKEFIELNAAATVKNLNIIGTGIKYIIVAQAEATFENVNITADNACISAADTTGHAVARNCTFRFVKSEHTRNDHQESWAPVSSQYGATLELFDCILTSSDGYGMMIWPSGGTLEVTRCSITSAKGYAVSWIGNNNASSTYSDSIVRVNNCTIEGSSSCEAKYHTVIAGREAYIYKDGVLVATTASA